MRRKRFTVCENSQREKAVVQWTEPKILGEKNLNLVDIVSNYAHKAQLKRNYLTRRAFTLKYHKAQLDQCWIDIANRKSQTEAMPKPQRENKKVSNIELLKKQIQYLQEDKLKWQKFPKEGKQFIKTDYDVENRGRTADINLQSIEQIMYEGHRSPIIDGFTNSFKKNIFIAPLERPMTSQEKMARKYFSASKKKSTKKMTVEGQSSKQNEGVGRSIHSKAEAATPFRKYFQANRTRKNTSCSFKMDEIVGRKISRLASFTLEDLL